MINAVKSFVTGIGIILAVLVAFGLLVWGFGNAIFAIAGLHEMFEGYTPFVWVLVYLGWLVLGTVLVLGAYSAGESLRRELRR